MQVNPGELKHKIVIADQDDNIIHTCYASVNQISHTEKVKNNVQFGEETTRFLIRCTKKQIASDYSIKFNNCIYDIQGEPNDYNFSHEYIEISAKKRSYGVV